MVELNATVFPFLGPIGSLINTFQVLVGGVFGVYLIILYLKWREYVVMKHMLTDIRKDLRVIASHQNIELEPIKDHKLVAMGKHVKNIWRKKREDKQKEQVVAMKKK